MKDKSSSDKINPAFIALTAMAIYNCLSARTTDELMVLPEFSPGSGAQRMCNTRNINDMV